MGQRGRLRRVQRDHVACIAHAISGVHDAPGEVDALVRVAKLGGPAANLVEHRPGYRDRPFPHGGHVAAPGRIAGPQARDPVSARLPACAGRDPQLKKAELRVHELGGDSCESVVLREARIVVEEEQELAARMCDACVPATGDADVLREPHASNAGREAVRPPAVSDHDHVDVDVALSKQGVDGTAQLGGAATLAENDAGDAQRSRLEVRIASRWPAAVTAATGSRASSRTREPARSPAIASTIAAVNASSVNSIATNARKKGRNLKAR